MADQQEQTGTFEYAQAFGAIRGGKNLFWVLAGLCILIQLVCFILVQFFGVLDNATEIQATTTTTAPASPVAALVDPDAWYYALQWILPTTKFIAVVSALLLAVTIFTGVQVSLLGRLGGVSGLMGAFFWSLVLLALVVPWQQLLGGTLAAGVLYNLGHLVEEGRQIKTSWGAEETSLTTVILYYARFLAYPVVGLIVWLVVQGKFVTGSRRMAAPPAGEIE